MLKDLVDYINPCPQDTSRLVCRKILRNPGKFQAPAGSDGQAWLILRLTLEQILGSSQAVMVAQ